MLCAYKPEDVSVLAANNSGVKETGLGWGLRQYNQNTNHRWSHWLICACQSSRCWRPFGGSNRLLDESQQGQKHDRFKLGTCLFKHLFCQWREQIARDSLCVCGLWTWIGKCKSVETKTDLTYVLHLLIIAMLDFSLQSSQLVSQIKFKDKIYLSVVLR